VAVPAASIAARAPRSEGRSDDRRNALRR
jgi:hypothetical protein